MAERLADLRTPEGALPDERYDVPEPAAAPKPGWKARMRARKPSVPGEPFKKPAISGDMVIGGLGVALGVACALFPWYIFMHPEQFKLKGYQFSGGPQGAHPSAANSQPGRIGTALNLPETSQAALDMFPTGTVPDQPKPPATADEKDQPFPGDTPRKPDFNLIEVANGRAMIEDSDGIWVVQVGSPLPNDSRVAAIEQRGGDWVLVTSAKDVIKLGK